MKIKLATKLLDFLLIKSVQLLSMVGYRTPPDAAMPSSPLLEDMKPLEPIEGSELALRERSLDDLGEPMNDLGDGEEIAL